MDTNGGQIMTNLEKVEKLREKTGVTYEEAKAALAVADWDMLDAILQLEREGKIEERQSETKNFTSGADHSGAEGAAGSQQSFQTTDTPQLIAESYQSHQEEQKSGKRKMDVFWAWCKKILKKSVDNKFIVTRHGEQVMEMPVLLLVVLLLASVWTILIVLAIGLFFGFGYRFAGPDLGREDINETMAKVNNVADNIKSEFQHEKNS